ncbi:MAG: EamA family transporter, partial [Candidatus Lambdaproteobacteria bacterium]|nr:EamA family transporter [Candidatus Lambdaproteobacteria bacterium]
PAEANALNYTWPLWIVVLSGALPGHRLTGRVVLAGLLGFAGVLVVLTGSTDAAAPAGAPPVRALGLALALGAGFCWGSFTVLLRRFAAPEQENMALFCLCGAALAGLHALAAGVPLLPQAGELPVLLYLGLVPLALAFVLWERAVARAHLHRLGLLSFITPPLSMALLALATGVALPWRVLAGLALILLGMVVGRGFRADPASPAG